MLMRVLMPLLAGLLLGSGAFAATLQPMQGDVRINHGAGYQTITQQTVVAVGDSVMVGKGGSAQIVYNTQCSVAVRPGNVVTIAAEPPCPKTAWLEPDSGRMDLGADCQAGDKHFCAPPVEDRGWIAPAGIVAALGVTVGLCASGVICESQASP